MSPVGLLNEALYFSTKKVMMADARKLHKNNTFNNNFFCLVKRNHLCSALEIAISNTVNNFFDGGWRMTRLMLSYRNHFLSP